MTNNTTNANALLILLLLLLSPWSALQALPQDQDTLLQFTAAGHVLGFQSDGFYVAGGDHMLHVGFVGSAGVVPEAQGAGQSQGQAQPLTRVRYDDIWPGIDLEYEAVGGGIARSTWRLDAGADAGQIALRYNVPVAIANDGSLRLRYASGWLRESAPVAWQEIDGERRPVEVAFRRVASSADTPVLGFAVGAHDPGRPLLIDPTMGWTTFMGSADEDIGQGIAVDGSGNVYVTGYSRETWGSPVNAHAGGPGPFDAFVAKFDSTGTLVWNTFMGSIDEDEGNAVAVDTNGNVYVAGYSEGSWGSPVNPHTASFEAFAAKLDSDGNRVWNTFMGAAEWDFAGGIAVDSSGNVYVAGHSDYAWGMPVNPHSGGYLDVFAAKLDSNGNRSWNTFMGSPGNDYGYGIAVDGSGNVYVMGNSDATWGTPVNAYAGDFDVFAAKLDSAGNRPWNTFMGSAETDWPFGGVAVDGSGNVYIAGSSAASWGTPVNAHAGAYDAFAAKLDTNGNRLWNTFMGSSYYGDFGYAIAVDDYGSIYVAGASSSAWGSPVHPHSGGSDGFAAELDGSGVLVWSTFMGEEEPVSEDAARGVAVDSIGNVHVTGQAGDTWGSPVTPQAGGYDAFIQTVRPIEPYCAFGDELAADFGIKGVWNYTAGGWTKLTGYWNPGPAGLAGWVSGMAVDFDANGVWNHDGTGWSRIASWDAGNAMAGWLGGLAADFDADGVWTHDGSMWTRLASWDADALACWANGLAVDFGSYGVWNYDGASWSRLATWDAGNGGLSGWENGLAVDFDGYGGWNHDGISWARIASWDVGDAGMSRWTDGLAVDFDGYGLWNRDPDGLWTKLSPYNPGNDLAGWASNLAVDFDVGGLSGLWNHDGSGWSRIATWEAEALTDVDLD